MFGIPDRNLSIQFVTIMAIRRS